MRKILIWIQMSFHLPMVWLSAKKLMNSSFAERFEKACYWSKMVVKKMKMDLVCIGADKVPTDEAIYFVSNHQGALDPFVVLSVMPVPVTAVSKIENSKIPFVSGWFKALEVVWLDRSNLRSSLKMVGEVADKLKEGRNVVIFPEGTRSKGPEMGEFKAGSLKPAYIAKATIVPITLMNTYVIDVKGKRDNRGKIIFSDPIKFEEYENLSTVELADKLKKIIQKNLDGGL